MAILVIITFLLSLTYNLRFAIFGIPSNLLMAWVVLVWAAFGGYLAAKSRGTDFLRFVQTLDKNTFLALSLFVIAGLMALNVGGVGQKDSGQFLALVLQPVSLFFIAGYLFKAKPEAKNWLLASLYWLLAVLGAVAIFQYLTLKGLSPVYWGNSLEPKRATSLFGHPNFYALFAAPLLAFLIPDMARGAKSFRLPFWLLGAAGLLLSLSRAGWLGLGAALAVYSIAAAGKKFKAAAAAVLALAIIAAFSITNVRYRLLLPFYGEKSAVSRLSLWQTGIKAVKESPLKGLGFTGFAQNWDRLNTDPNIDRHNFPHNVFLNFWVEMGLLGLIGFLFLAALKIWRGIASRRNPLLLGMALFFITLVCQGLIDNPYFKNDLAMVFWIMLSLAI